MSTVPRTPAPCWGWLSSTSPCSRCYWRETWSVARCRLVALRSRPGSFARLRPEPIGKSVDEGPRTRRHEPSLREYGVKRRGWKLPLRKHAHKLPQPHVRFHRPQLAHRDSRAMDGQPNEHVRRVGADAGYRQPFPALVAVHEPPWHELTRARPMQAEVIGEVAGFARRSVLAEVGGRREQRGVDVDDLARGERVVAARRPRAYRDVVLLRNESHQEHRQLELH